MNTTAARERVETPRLICERLRAEHAEELAVLHGDPRVARTLFDGGRPLTPAEVVEQLGPKLAHWERFGFGQWLLRDRATGAMVGRGGLQHTLLAGVEEIEVGWAVVPERWGQGLATEMALAAVRIGFEDLRLPRIVAFTQPENHASRRVMEKAGFSFERDIVHAGLPHVLYRRTASAP